MQFLIDPYSTVQKMIWSYLLKKSYIENFIFFEWGSLLAMLQGSQKGAGYYIQFSLKLKQVDNKKDTF